MDDNDKLLEHVITLAAANALVAYFSNHESVPAVRFNAVRDSIREAVNHAANVISRGHYGTESKRYPTE